MTQSILDKIKADALEARKARLSDKGAFLNTLASEIVMMGKNDGNRESTDEDSAKACAKFAKGLAETLSHRPDDERSKAELAWLGAYRPAQMDEAALREMVAQIAAERGIAKIGPKDMGAIMGGLKARAAGQYDGAMAKAVVEALSKA